MKCTSDASIQIGTLDCSPLSVNEHPFARELQGLGATQDQLDALRFASFEGLQVRRWPIQYPDGFPLVGEELARQYLTLRWLEVDQLRLLEAREQARTYVEERERPYLESLGVPRQRPAEPASSGWRSRRISVRDAAMIAMRSGHEKGLTLEQWLEKDAIASQRVRVVNQKQVAGYVVCIGDDPNQWITRSQLKVWWAQAESSARSLGTKRT